VTAVSLAGVLLAACGGGSVSKQLPVASTRPSSTSTSAGACSIVSRTTMAVTVENLTAVHFTSAVDGVALATGTCAQRGPVKMAVSHDSGLTWKTTGNVLWKEAPLAQVAKEHVVAVSSQHVWASQPDGPLLETQDGGRQWETEPVPTPVDQLAVVGNTVWTLSCTAVGVQATSTCTPVVEQQSVEGGPWRRLALPITSAFLRPTLDVVTPTTAVIFATPNGAAPGSAGRLVVTTDGGAQWSAQPLPTVPNNWCNAGGTSFTAGSATTWWLLCNGSAAAGSSQKALLQSTDGGGTWTTVAEVPDLQALRSPGSLTRADTTNVDAASPSLLWLASDIQLTESTDGGSHWRTVPTVQLGGGGTVASFDVYSPNRAWLLEPFDALWSTTDGTTWSKLH
jgi:photosystem II stability/assembly factor-like uncharacterized protein